MTTDATLNTRKGYHDFDWTETGDISTDETLDTFILMLIFGEVRATPAEVPQSNKRRGWVGNESTPGFEFGSKLWQFEQERVTGTMLAELGVVIRNSLQRLIDDGIAVSVEVEQPFLKNGFVCVRVNISRDGSKVDSFFFELWENTGVS